VVVVEKKDYINLSIIVAVFLAFFYLPINKNWFSNSIMSAFSLLHEYAREHVLTCLIPALFIAGAITVLVRKDKILEYLGPKAKKYISYPIASVSGALLAVCSCTILPLFAGIKKRGAGLGPAITFLFSGPAINVAAIFLTMSVLGFNIGIARIIGAISISILVGLTMALIFKDEIAEGKMFIQKEDRKLSNSMIAFFFIVMLGILIVNGLSISSRLKYIIMIILSLQVIVIAYFKFRKDLTKEWLNETWNFSKLILPLLFIGVFIAGFIMPLLPEEMITNLVGNNNILGNLIASVFGAFMYFSTLTEIPILQALISKGMHLGPALALLLAGPSLSLPNMLVIRGVLGNKKTIVYVSLVIVYSTIAGLMFGSLIIK
jgi:uncharacterized protein